MIGVVLVLVALVSFVVGVVAGLTHNARAEVRKGLAAEGLSSGAARRYRTAARILHDLVHVNDLDELMCVLPSPMQKRVEGWLNEHNTAIRNGTK